MQHSLEATSPDLQVALECIAEEAVARQTPCTACKGAG